MYNEMLGNLRKITSILGLLCSLTTLPYSAASSSFVCQQAGGLALLAAKPLVRAGLRTGSGPPSSFDRRQGRGLGTLSPSNLAVAGHC